MATERKLAIIEAIRLKRDLLDSPVCGELGPREIVSLARLTSEDWTGIWKHRAETTASRRLSVRAVLAVTIVLLAIYLLWWQSSWVLFLGGLIWIVTAYSVGTANGDRDGFFEGYDRGFEAGVQRFLGISDEDWLAICDMAREADQDERLLRRVAEDSKPEGLSTSKPEGEA